ncbi:MAG: hypothetical protein GF393_00835 [Armatimonadia bacterium]|nr:hypothetical protein [Armatimonadia bacterium]
MLSRDRAPAMLIVAIDGADYAITRELLDRGELPNLAALIDSGSWGPVASTTPPSTPPAWTTIMTGKNPGKHGVFDFLPMYDQAMETPIAARRKAMTLWRALSDAGMRVGTFNLPATYPPEDLSAFQISGFDAPGFGPSLAKPREALETLREAVGEYELCPFSIQDPEGDREALMQHAQIPVAGTRALLERYPCDVYMVSFQIVDWVHHGHLGREMQPLVPETLIPNGQVATAYRLVDEGMGQIIDEWMGDSTTVAVISDHGGASLDRLVNLEKVFLESGLLAYKAAGGDDAQLESRRSRAALALRAWTGLKRALPFVARLVAPLARRARGGLASYQEDVAIDWSQTRAAPWGTYAKVRFNVAGRDPEGIVPPEEVAALAEEVTDVLLSLRHPVSGDPVYAEVITGDELYDGPWASIGPDLYGVPAEPRYQSVSARLGVAELPLVDLQPEPVVELSPPWGGHSPLGIMALAGKGVAQGRVVEGAKLADFVPTLLRLLAQPIPEDLDGRALDEMLSEEVTATPAAMCEPWPAPSDDGGEDAYSEEERSAVEARLRNLGYM